MRSALFVLSMSLVIPGCARDPNEANETGTEGTEGGETAASTTGTDAESGTADSTTAVDETDSAEWTGDGDGGDGDGDTGDGDGDGSTGDGDGDGSTGDGDGDGGDGDTTTGSDCSMTITQEIDADEADLQGEWEFGMSQLAPEEGAIVYPLDYGASGSASFDLNFPCDDDWHVWVKGLDRGNEDSFFATVDGSPNPPAIFDIDCGGGNEQGSYEWQRLNERLPNTGCGIDNPWVISGEGLHVVSFEEREGGAISALAFSNDPNYTPNF